MPRISIRTLLGLVAFVAVGLAGLWASTDIWANGTFTATFLGIIVAVILAVYRQGERRAFWLGFALFGGLYLTVSRTSLDTSLVTTLGLAWLQEKWPKPGTMHIFLTEGMTPRKIWSNGTPANFHLIGHSLFALIVGCFGGLFARFAQRSSH